MTNLIVSRVCNQACGYCFAGDGAGDGQTPFMPPERFEQCLDYLDRSGIEQARFLGGEPTLHPRFAEFAATAFERGKIVIVFTNGLAPPAALDALAALPDERCSVVLNVSAGGRQNGEAVLRRQREMVERLGPKVQPGCNLHRLDADLEGFLAWMPGSGCKPAVRLGLAQPVLGGGNEHLPARLYRRAGERVLRFAEACAGFGFKVEFDCGFVRCMFSDAAVERLEALSAELGYRCSPIIDIDVDGAAFHCFPLAAQWREQALAPAARADDLRAAFLRRTEAYRRVGIYPQCAACEHRRDGTCSGGCLAHVLSRFSDQAVGLQ